jgi:hypothetical protein
MIDPWRSYVDSPPEWHRWEVIEWIRREFYKPLDNSQEPQTMNREQAMANPQWNVAGVYWRPVL